MLLPILGCVGIRTILDVGAGTGRAVEFFGDKGFQAFGIEPVAALVRNGQERNTQLAGRIVQGDGGKLPFADGSFDAVCAFGVMHHVNHPSTLVSEMQRVAKSAIVISDGNRFGQGRLFTRVLKLLLWKAGVWPICKWVRNGGRSVMLSDGDGLAYSYSVYDSFDQAASVAEKVLLLSTDKRWHKSWWGPLLTSSCVLMVATNKQCDQALQL